MAASGSRSTSLKEYLKRYESNNTAEELKKKGKKKKKKANAKPVPSGVLVINEDPIWQKPVVIEEEIDNDSDEEERPQVDEDIEVKRMRMHEQIRAKRAYNDVSEDGSGWVSLSSNPPQTSAISNSDLSPPGRGRARNDTYLPERTRPAGDLSPPRRGRARNDTPSPERGRPAGDLSPPRRGKARNDTPSPERRRPAGDLSPPRRGRACNDTPSPERRRPAGDLSPPRRGRSRNDTPSPERGRPAGDLSLPHRGRARNDTPSPERRKEEADMSPPRKRQSRWRDSLPANTSDLSPPRKSTEDGDDDDLSPPGRTQKEDSIPVTKVQRKTGLITGREMREEVSKTKTEDMIRFRDMDPSISGRNAEPIYRDKMKGERISKEEFVKSRQKVKEKPKEIKIEWGKGLAQKWEAEAKMQELELEKDKPFARTRDDADLDRTLKDALRWGDPMAHLVKRKQSELILPNLGENEKMKESGFIIPQDIPNHSWLKRGMDAAPNRYGIKPGRHWDGVDRSNGFEKESFKRTNEKQATEREAYLWSVADM